MSNLSLEEFFHDLHREVVANAEANQDFIEVEFTQNVASELIGSGVIEGFEDCYYRPPSGGVRVDGYCFNDNDISLDLFITDFSKKETIEALTQTEVSQIFKRLENFYTQSAEKKLYLSLEETSPGYGLSRQISERNHSLSKINFFLISDRSLSNRLKTLDDRKHGERYFSYNIWDISRLHRLHTSMGTREELEINFLDITSKGLPCLPAHLNSASYRSYLLVMPALVLAGLYEKYGARLLEQNVRSFLQARGNVNSGIRTTILNDPEMFFAYNNGITATAREVETVSKDNQVLITSIKDLQIVNGGQTTASLFHTQRKDKASLDKIFVQVKLSVVDQEKSEEVVPRISEYANTQNKVNAADFFSNHPYHVRMESYSRRIWAPALKGAQRETKWFYERARGQYADAQNKLTLGEKKRFLNEYPKPQMFTKTDLAKFENVWDEKPTSVNLGAQKNFAKYAIRIGSEWTKNPDAFNELYYKRVIARAILFKKTEKLVSAQSWYNGGYRANIVAYTLALLSKICRDLNKYFDFKKVWNLQDVSDEMIEAIEITAKVVFDTIMTPVVGISNISEWCKRDDCWEKLQKKSSDLKLILPTQFLDGLILEDFIIEEIKSATYIQKIDNGIDIQKRIINIPSEQWLSFLDEGKKRGFFSDKELGILNIAVQIPNKIPTEKQSIVLSNLIDRAEINGLKI